MGNGGYWADLIVIGRCLLKGRGVCFRPAFAARFDTYIWLLCPFPLNSIVAALLATSRALLFLLNCLIESFDGLKQAAVG
jgi:hypothetical protein